MAIFGNTGTDSDNLGLPDEDQFGHYDYGKVVSQWAADIPVCTVTKLYVYARGRSGFAAATLRMAVYDASDSVNDNWTVEAESPAFSITADGIAKWYSVNCDLSLTAGKKALAIISYNGHDTSANIYYNDKDGADTGDIVTFIGSAGVFEDPLGGSEGGLKDWCMYAEYTEISSTTDDVTITSNMRVIDPNVFTFASPSTTVSKGNRNYNTFDIKLKHICSHYLSNIQYTLGKCPRCLGTGYYYDAKFNEMGRLIQISLEDKLQQALEKLVLTDENKFHTDVAIGLKKWLGEVPISKIKAIIEYDLMEGIATLKSSQKRIEGLSPRAQISTIDDIAIIVLDENSLHYVVTVTTVSGETTNLEGTINFSDITLTD